MFQRLHTICQRQVDYIHFKILHYWVSLVACPKHFLLPFHRDGSWRMTRLTNLTVVHEPYIQSLLESERQKSLFSCCVLVVSSKNLKKRFDSPPRTPFHLSTERLICTRRPFDFKSSPWLLTDAALGRSTKISGLSTLLPAMDPTTGSVYHKRSVHGHPNSAVNAITKT